MSLKHGILGLLSYGPMTGYDLHHDFNVSLAFFWPAKQSQIYRELLELETKGFVVAEHIVQTGKPNKKVYSLTEDGRHALQQWIVDYAFEDSLKWRDAFLMRIYFSEQHGDDALLIEALNAYIALNETYLQSLQQVEEQFLDETKLFWHICLRKGVYDFQANIAWANETLERLAVRR